MTTGDDLLADVAWCCAFARPGSSGDAEDLGINSSWFTATVPGTAARCFSDTGADGALTRDYDRQEWWYRCRFDEGPVVGPHLLGLGGLATIADVYLNGVLVLHSENMFVAHEVVVDLEEHNELLIRFSPLADVVKRRRPRPRWRTGRLANQNLRWIRTTLLGRMVGWARSPAPVGPWRPVTLIPVPDVRVFRTLLTAEPGPVDGTGRVHVRARITGLPAGTEATVTVGLSSARSTLVADDEGCAIDIEVEVEGVELWWPHTHGAQPLYDVAVGLAGSTHPVGRVGFRTLNVDRERGRFEFHVNGVPIFARGTNWIPPDPVNLAVSDERLRHNVRLLRDGNHNMVRVSGVGFWEGPAFLDLLDELGILLWQDCMFAFVDVPDDPEFLAGVVIELDQAFSGLQGRPSLALVCGGADTEEQAEYMGVAHDQWSSEVSRTTIPGRLEALLPGTAYLRSTPGDSPLPTAVNEGVSHYFGVGGYRRPISDVRASEVKFAAECLPIATPPEVLDAILEERQHEGYGLMPDPRSAVHRDAHAIWDLEDVSDYYTREIFGVDVLALRQRDPERAGQLFRATTAELYETVLSEWRRPGSPCAGALTLYGHDLRYGPGLGMVDVLDRPKASWYVMRQLMQPVAILLTDEGLSGLAAHVVNETAERLEATVRLDLYRDGELLLESATTTARVPARGSAGVDTQLLFGSFRDLSYAHRFGEPAADVVSASLLDADGCVLSRAVFLPETPVLVRSQDLGLRGTILDGPDGPAVEVSTDRFAQRVTLEVSGWYPEDSWFHLLPGETRRIGLRRLPWGSPEVAGRISALNSSRATRLASQAE